MARYKRRGVFHEGRKRDGEYRRSTHGTHPFYATAEWKRVRRLVIERDQYQCCDCGEYLGRGGAHVDHIVSMARAPERALDATNLRTLCHQCHSVKTARMDGSFGADPQEDLPHGCDESGIPKNPKHPWNSD